MVDMTSAGQPTATTPCPSDSIYLRYVEGELDADVVEVVELHLAECPSCQRMLMAFARATATLGDGPGVEEVDATLPRRYSLRGRLGRGGQGVVWRVWDDALQREVALKLVGIRDPKRRARLQREAQMLARLEHPAVLQIFDVDLDGDPGFISMPLCVGSLADPTLRPPTTERVVECFVAIAEGLGAVHAAGVLHRDIKPSNLLVVEDGSVRIADFGLAVGAPGTVDDASASVSKREGCGTPGYLAPEVVRGAPHSPLSDQYGFFVSLREVLGGGRLSRKDGPALPFWLAELIERGLAEAPRDRFSSMQEVAERLRAGQRTNRSRPWVVGAVTLSAVVAAFAGWSTSRDAPQVPSACGEQTPMAWDAETRDRTRTALDDGELMAQAARYVTAWEAARARACAVADEPAFGVLRCLWRRGERFEALLAQARTGLDPDERRALQRALPIETSFDHCERAPSSVRLQEEPSDLDRATIARDVLALWADARLGREAPPEAVLDGWARDPRLRSHGDLAAEVLLLQGAVADGREAKEELFERAAHLAHRADAAEIEARAWREVAMDQIRSDGPPERAMRALSFADAALSRAGDPEAARIELEVGRIVVTSTSQESSPDVIVEQARALTRRARAFGSDALLSGVLATQAQTEALAANFDAALRVAEEASVVASRAYAPMESAPLRIDTAYARRLSQAGRNAEAIALLEGLIRRLEVAEPNSVALGVALGDLATAQLRVGDADASRASANRELEAYRRAGGSTLEILAEGRIGDAALALGDSDAAVAHFVHAQTLAESSLGTEHSLTLELRKKLAEARTMMVHSGSMSTRPK